MYKRASLFRWLRWIWSNWRSGSLKMMGGWSYVFRRTWAVYDIELSCYPWLLAAAVYVFFLWLKS